MESSHIELSIFKLIYLHLSTKESILSTKETKNINLSRSIYPKKLGSKKTEKLLSKFTLPKQISVWDENTDFGN